MVLNKKSSTMFNRAAKLIPGAVNSPVRAWRAVGGTPLFIDRAEAAYVIDIDGNRLLDYVGAYGPAILGHAHPQVVNAIVEQARDGFGYGAPTELEVTIAEMISQAVPAAEKIRLLSSGTEAGMTALRIARAATGRPRILKFDGCYHGHSDALLVRAGSGGMTLGIADSAGVPDAIAGLTTVARYNSLASVEQCFAAFPGEIAAVIVESVPANMGVVPPADNFLGELSALAHRHGALLICDEVITGFRLRYGAAYELYRGVDPDLLMFGKVIGGGLPIGAVAGRAELMDLLAPIGPVYQAGTLSGNPLSVRAGIETLKILRQPGIYESLESAGARLADGLRMALQKNRQPGCVNRAGSLLTMFIGENNVIDAESARRCDTKRFAHIFHRLLERGIYVPPSQFEAMFVSIAHGRAEIDRTIEAADQALRATDDR
jgi:glutamate-1-semialdehyde 2,1-aminomutase